LTTRDVAFTFDAGFMPGALVAVRSAAAAIPVGTRVWIVSGAIPAEARHRLASAAAPHRVHFVDAPVIDLPLYGAKSAAVYMRLRLASLLPDVETVLYLDADTVTLASLSPLLETDFAGHGVAAVQDHLWRNGPDSTNAGYFNTGVMLIDLRRWRDRQIGSRAEKYVESHHCRFWDQDALNAVLFDDWLELDPEWNVFHFDEVADPAWSPLSPAQAVRWWRILQQRARVMHYVTAVKPWRAGYPLGVNRSRFERFAR
jgi:lipopolysaccharide biosynthesis glycosyltransferase